MTEAEAWRQMALDLSVRSSTDGLCAMLMRAKVDGETYHRMHERLLNNLRLAGVESGNYAWPINLSNRINGNDDHERIMACLLLAFQVEDEEAYEAEMAAIAAWGEYRVAKNASVEADMRMINARRARDRSLR